MQPATRVLTVLGALTVSLGVAGLAGQELPPRLEAPRGSPPEVQQAEAADPIARAASKAPTRALVLAKLEELKPGSTKPENLKGGKPLAAATPPPAEAGSAGDQAPAPAAEKGRAPASAELLQKLRELPGGAARLEEAKRRGAPISIGSGSVKQWLALLWPFAVTDAWAQTPTALALTPAAPAVSTPLLANLTFYRSMVYPSVNLAYIGLPADGSFAAAGGKPVGAVIRVNIATPGWYILNFTGYASVGTTNAELQHYQAGGTWTPVTTWQIPLTAKGDMSFPALVELGAGTHYLRFGVVSAPGGLLLFKRFDLMSLR